MITPQQIQEYARKGAAIRLEQIETERASIHQTFPELAGKPDRRGRRRPMSRRERADVSARMTRYWAARRKRVRKAHKQFIQAVAKQHAHT